ncbi:protocatechuate 3,4-dioxygenase subunit alpha [Angustibacter sp. McL0619]|uniref:protocatechuate 3,4-dioxygenase subunit alpha n=1 Tax=Angustibacter sp. McL0619 TaxID=3415676 RepID=UPI003CF1A57F
MTSEPVGTDVLGTTPSQTVGPYLSLGLIWPDGAYAVPAGTLDAFWVRGHVLDGAGEPVPDALVETWQCDPAGRFDHPDAVPRRDESAVPQGFRGFARSATDADGRWAVLTVRPGRLPDDRGGTQAPHLDVSVFARGLLDRVVTRIYLPDEQAANDADHLLRAVAADRRPTLVASAGPDGLVFDIHLRGDHETVYFDL